MLVKASSRPVSASSHFIITSNNTPSLIEISVTRAFHEPYNFFSRVKRANFIKLDQHVHPSSSFACSHSNGRYSFHLLGRKFGINSRNNNNGTIFAKYVVVRVIRANDNTLSLLWVNQVIRELSHYGSCYVNFYAKFVSVQIYTMYQNILAIHSSSEWF